MFSLSHTHTHTKTLLHKQNSFKEKLRGQAMGPLVVASQLATGLGVLAGAMLVKSAMDQETQAGPMAGGGWRAPRCARCNGTGRVTCMCSRWSDGDVGCRTCAGSGRMACSSCGGLPMSVSMRNNRPL